MFNTDPVNVATPEVPVVVNVIPAPELGRDDTLICLVLLLSAESDISIKSSAAGLALVGYVYIIAIISFFF